MARAKTLRCPACRALVLAGSEDFPFCSDRCRRIDLGKWASGAYVVSSPIHDPEQLDELEALRRGSAPSAAASRHLHDRDGE